MKVGRAAEAPEGDLVVLAVPYTAAPHAVRQHAGELAGAAMTRPNLTAP
jgi:predicted dinucleotide-binding enzyme